MRLRPTILCAVLGALALLQSPAHADPRGPGRRGDPWRFDPRYSHNHYYPSVGYVAYGLPGGSLSIAFGTGHLFFNSGVWFRPYADRYVVIAPPVGVMVPVLPPDGVPVWVGSTMYYYLNGVYYLPTPGRGFAVVPPPPSAETAQAAVPAPIKPPPTPVIYPRNGQSPAQTEADRQDCNRWATTQQAALLDAEVFQRAVAACMDGRGYTVR